MLEILREKYKMNSVLIIAEAGVNHNGSLDLARKLIDVAATAGVDYVKFQTFRADKIASKHAAKAEYQAEVTDKNESQLDMLKRLELSYDDHLELMDYCSKKKIRFLSTPFDLESITLLKELGVTVGKIPSGELTNLPYLRKMAQSFDSLILSTGMSDMNEIEEAVTAITDTGFTKEKLTVLHCNTEYPTPFEDVNLRAMQTIAQKLGVQIGYSDHTKGIEVPVAAVALGAIVIEKHFTLDRSMEGPDHKASLEPDELIAMTASIRNIEKALGNGVKEPSPSEMKNRVVARKSLVALRDLGSGHILSESDLTSKRPGTGVSPMELYNVVGKALRKPIRQDDVLTLEHLAE